MRTVELERPPRLGGLYLRALAGLLPGRGGGGERVPDTELVVRGVRAEGARLVAYARVCGFALTGTLPATYPHVLAFPLALKLMTAPDFPFPPTGVVHLANRIEVRRPVRDAEALDLAVRVENLRAHPRGRQLDVVATATVDGVEVWRDVSTYLRRERTAADAAGEGPPASTAGEGPPASTAGADGAPAAAERGDGPPAAPGGGGAPATDGGGQRRGRTAEPEGTPPEPTAVWRVAADTGRAYAAVSGDRNPIHVSNLAARAFGFRRRIAHGMWTMARCLAQLAPKLPEAYVVDVTFRSPILLPSTVHFHAAPEPDGWRMSVTGATSGRTHLAGRVTRI
ncbi:MAG: MaoC/PaaZ C-terminal domain-containing protein [Micromonosporaceae bacterium]